MRYEPLTTLAFLNSPITTSSSGRSRFNQRNHSTSNGTIRYLMDRNIQNDYFSRLFQPSGAAYVA